MSMSWLMLAPTQPIAPPMSGWQIFALVMSSLAGLGVVGSFLYIRETRRKITAEAKKLEVEPEVLLSQQAMEMYDRLRAELKDTQQELRSERTARERVESHVRELEDELRRHGITPPRWPPLESVP